MAAAVPRMQFDAMRLEGNIVVLDNRTASTRGCDLVCKGVGFLRRDVYVDKGCRVILVGLNSSETPSKMFRNPLSNIAHTLSLD